VKTDPTTRRRAKALRRDLTDAERILWSHLKGDRMGGWRVRLQHPVSPYILDFAIAPLRIGIEIDGATHVTAKERAYDARRAAELERQGWTLLRFWNVDVYKNLEGVLSVITDALPPKS
jgi:very-short-patch-repair endonuclease